MSDSIDMLCGRHGFVKAKVRVFLNVVAISIILIVPGQVAAQTASGLTPDQLQQFQQNRGSAPQQAVTTHETILEPTAASNPTLPVSNLEQILSSRAGMPLRQFGYDQMGIGRSVTLPQMGAVQDDYVLGLGDEIVVSLRGQENSEYRSVVDRDGRIVLPRINPLSAAGRTFGQFQKDLLNAVHRAYVSTEAFVSIGHLRQVSVLVSGEVGSPGVRTLTGLSTPIDAILVSGGVKKSGSLRNIRIVRGGHEFAVDLYSVLVSGVQSKRVALADGDKIIVPPIGATVAVAGEARRPGIYELPAGRTAVSVREAVAMASGTTVPGAYRVSQLRTMPDGKRQLVDVTGASETVLHDGEIVLVRTSVNWSINQVTVVGAVRTPGLVALGKFKTIHDLLPSVDVFLPGAYLLFGIVEHTDPVTLQRTVIPFSPLSVIQGKSNFALASDDTVRIFTKAGMRSLLDLVMAPKPESGVVTKGRSAESSTGVGGAQTTQTLEANALVNAQGGEGLVASHAPIGQGTVAQLVQSGGRGSAIGAAEAAQAGAAAPGAVGTTTSQSTDAAVDAGLGGFSAAQISLFGKTIAHYQVIVSGAVHETGGYLVFPGTPIADLLVAAGGLDDDVDLSSFELTSTNIDNVSGISTTERKLYPATKEVFANTGLKAFDRLVFRTVYSDRSGGLVYISGEVRNPGSFDILRGERLSSVLRRAGGYTEIAYPEGAVFRRSSVAQAEQEESSRIAADMRSQLLAYLLKPQTGGGNQGQTIGADTIGAIQLLLAQISSTPALGRVPVVADQPTLEKHQEFDIMLEPGDSIVVPRHPATVLVVGEVQRTGAQRFEPSNNVDDYVDKAGGTTEMADTSRIIVVLPDGSVTNSENSWLNFGSDSGIPAGSTIYVPRKLEVYQFRQLLTDSIQIISQLATTAAALAVLSKQ